MTKTATFGTTKRENHDSTPFYKRFKAAEETMYGQLNIETISGPHVDDSRNMPIQNNSVALIVTSPPYYAGKEFDLDPNAPESFEEFVRLLHDVFVECERVLEPGGRIAVNVANLGRKPWRSLSATTVNILEDIGFLLRGEIIWQKGKGANNSCAWGTFQEPHNPVLRDLTERVIVASKGSFSRLFSKKQRKEVNLPHETTISKEEFMEATLDVWEIPPESAKRIGHPAPFPVKLPERLIQLYTYKNDLVLDPFMGSGSTLVAAKNLHRRYVGYDINSEYVELAQRRLANDN